MPRNDTETTVKIGADISQLKKRIQDAKRQISLANSEFKASATALEDWQSSTEGVSAKLKQLDTTLKSQKTILASLEEQYRQVVEEQGEGSAGAERLKIAINNQQSAINKTQSEIGKYNDVLAELEDESEDVSDDSKKASKAIDEVGDSAEKSESKASKLAKSLGGALKKGLAGLVAAGAGAVTAFLASGEATQEFTEDMGKLETAFKTSGHTVETAKESYRDMVGILGETDQSVEAVNHLAKLTKSQKELAKWTDISAGVYATFGDSLPLEGLTEASNETAKVGQVTGPLADALNWAGVSEDKFNEQLKKCNSESERATLITNTLTDIYQKAGKEYQKVNGDLIANRQATSDMSEAMAEMGKVAMPITTALKQGFADLLTTALPSITQIGDAVRGMMDGTEGSSDKLQEGLESLFTGLLAKVTEMLPSLITIGLNIITALIQGIVQAFPRVVNTIIQLIPQISQALLQAIPNIVAVLGEVVGSLLQALGQLLPKIVTQIVEIVPQLVAALVGAIPTLLQGAIQFFNAIIQALPTIIQALMQALPRIITTIIQVLTNGIPLLAQGAVILLMAIVDALPQIIDALTKALPDIITAIINGLVTALPQILEAAITLFMALVDAIPQIIVTLADALPDIIDAITTTLLDNMDKILECGVTLLMALVKAVPKIVVALGKAMPKIIVAIMTALGKLLPKLVGFSVKIRAKVLTFMAEMIKKGATKAGEFVAKLMDKIKDLPSKLAQKFNDAVQKAVDFASKFKEKAVDAGKKFAKALTDKLKSLPKDVKSIGRNIVTGLWSGINDKFSWLTGKIKSFTSDVTGKMKKFFGIHSPSRVMRDQVGKYISLGIAEGIKNHEKSVTNAVTNLGKHVLSTLKKNMKEKEFKKLGSNLVSKLTEGINSKVSKFNDSISKITDKYDKLIDDVKKKRETLSETLSNMGDGLYTKDDNGNIVLSDIKKQTKEVKAYAKNLKKLKGKISKSLINEILSMDANEGYAYTEALLSLNDRKLKAYNKAYTQKVKESDKIAKAWYKADINRLKSQYTDKVTKVIKKMVKDVSKAGTDALNGFLKAFKGNNAIEKSLNSFCNRVVKTIKKKFKIKSPSRVMRDEVGKYLSLGIAEGVTQNKDAVTKALSNVAEPLNFGLSNVKGRVVNPYAKNALNGASTSTNNTYTFNQYNNSPKALSRLEIYRQTRNQLNFAKGV